MNEQESVESPPAGRTALWPAAAALLWLAAACSGDPLCPPGTLPGLCGLEGRCLECNTAADCGSDQGCSLDGACYDVGSGHGAICTSDADCPEGQLCREGLCLVRCSSRADCRDNQDCAEGVCISRRCSAQGSCPEGWEPVPDSLACRPLAAGEHADPWTVMPSAELAQRRGWRVVRGIVHSHSPYSHDACDDQPFIDGQRNEPCFAEVRAGLCQTAQDFVFLTDHADSFADHEYPDVLLYAAGDSLIERGGRPVANRLACPDGRRVIVAAGTETGLMPIGLEHHLGDSPAERHAWYQRSDAEALRALQAAGALVFLQHTEGWSIEQIQQLPIDGIECYNLHQNLMDNMGAALEMALLLDQDPAGMPAVELALITVFQENSRDLERWAIGSLAAPLPAVLATDAHRNVFSEPSPDGERLDSFRRMMHWFSNYVLVPAAAELDDAGLKQAIGSGRLYGGFDYLGYPLGFDFFAETTGAVYEMGALVPAAESPELVLQLPTVYRLDPQLDPPAVRGRILRAEPDGSWTELASSRQDIRLPVGPGSYRAEVRQVPHHLRPWLGDKPDYDIPDKLIRELPWIYANPITVVE